MDPSLSNTAFQEALQRARQVYKYGIFNTRF